AVHAHFQGRLVERRRTYQRLADEVTGALKAHLAGLGQPHVDDFTVLVRSYSTQQEVAVLLEARVLSPEETEHAVSVACPARSAVETASHGPHCYAFASCHG